MENKFYVYLHIKETTGEPFYVGKGSGNRFNLKSGRSTWWKKTVNKHGYDVVFLETNLTEQESLEKETYWIERIGRKDLGHGPLVNLTNGGEGVSNPSKETRDKMSKIHKNKIVSDEFREKCRNRMIGNKINSGNINSIKNLKQEDFSLGKNGRAKKVKYLDEEFDCIKSLYNSHFSDRYEYHYFTSLVNKNKINNIIKL